MPEQCASVLALLSESYNPHVRYGAAMALGIACAGTGLKDAIALLEPMINDPVNYVRQGALIASALVLIQQNESTCPKMVQFRTLYAKVTVYLSGNLFIVPATVNFVNLVLIPILSLNFDIVYLMNTFYNDIIM